jgi:hypothetical protein
MMQNSLLSGFIQTQVARIIVVATLVCAKLSGTKPQTRNFGIHSTAKWVAVVSYWAFLDVFDLPRPEKGIILQLREGLRLEGLVNSRKLLLLIQLTM